MVGRTSLSKRGLVLFAHGARSATWAQPFERLRDGVRSARPGCVVELAFLELMTPSLPDCVAQMVPRGIGHITVLPVFLGQGGHLQRDLPALADSIRALHPDLVLEVTGPVGEHPAVQQAMTALCLSLLGDENSGNY